MRTFGVLGSLLAGTAVAGGAFGAHSLKAVLAPDMLTVFETAVRYQMYHALALLMVGFLADRRFQKPARYAGWAFVAGILLFSGSLYVLSLTGLRWLGAVTPLGGLCFLIGWGLLAWTFWHAVERQH